MLNKRIRWEFGELERKNECALGEFPLQRVAAGRRCCRVALLSIPNISSHGNHGGLKDIKNTVGGNSDLRLALDIHTKMG
jgi:hypothetical protein